MIQFLIKLPGIHLDLCLSKESVSAKTTMMPNRELQSPLGQERFWDLILWKERRSPRWLVHGNSSEKDYSKIWATILKVHSLEYQITLVPKHFEFPPSKPPLTPFHKNLPYSIGGPGIWIFPSVGERTLEYSKRTARETPDRKWLFKMRFVATWTSNFTIIQESQISFVLFSGRSGREQMPIVYPQTQTWPLKTMSTTHVAEE